MSPEDERDERIKNILYEMVGDAMLNADNLMLALWPEETAFTGAHMRLAQTMLHKSVEVRHAAHELLTVTLEHSAVIAYDEEIERSMESDAERRAENAHFAREQRSHHRSNKQ